MSENIVSISLKDVEHVAKLARIAITEEEKKKYQEQLAKILDYVSVLQKKNTDNVAITSHPYDVVNVWREDEARVFPNISELFKNAPESEETFFKVKKVIE